MTRALVVIQTQADRDKAARWAQGVPMGSRIEFKETKRSLPQNDRLWAMLTDVAIHMKKQGRDHTPDQWKVIFMAAYGHEVKFLPTLDQKSFIPLGHSSSDLSVREMTDLIEFMLAWGAEAGVVFNDPKEQDSGNDPQPEAEGVALSSPQEPADTAPKSAGSELTQDEIRTHLMDFARKALVTAGDKSLPDPKRLELVEFMQANYRDVLPDTEWGKLSTIMIGLQAVLSGKRTIEQARRFFAVDLLETTVEELGG